MVNLSSTDLLTMDSSNPEQTKLLGSSSDPERTKLMRSHNFSFRRWAKSRIASFRRVCDDKFMCFPAFSQEQNFVITQAGILWCAWLIDMEDEEDTGCAYLGLNVTSVENAFREFVKWQRRNNDFKRSMAQQKAPVTLSQILQVSKTHYDHTCIRTHICSLLTALKHMSRSKSTMTKHKYAHTHICIHTYMHIHTRSLGKLAMIMSMSGGGLIKRKSVRMRCRYNFSQSRQARQRTLSNAVR
jgi:hypothetical protein